MDPLDYETLPQMSKTGLARNVYWIIFTCALLPGSFLWATFIVVYVKIKLAPIHVVRPPSLDDMPLRFLALGILMSGLGAWATRAILKNDRVGWGYALTFGFFGPILTLLVIIVLS